MVYDTADGQRLLQFINERDCVPGWSSSAAFFNLDADDAVNYGAIAAVIGHELTHGFDDSGRHFDATGNLRDWWLPADAKNFEERASCVIRQFDSFKVEDLSVNGKLVAGESIADLGGLGIAYDAFQNTLKGQPRPKAIVRAAGERCQVW